MAVGMQLPSRFQVSKDASTGSNHGKLVAQIYFPTDRSNLDSQDKDELDKLAAYYAIVMRANAMVDMTFEGHADYRHTEKHNRQLSLERAYSVKSYIDAQFGGPTKYSSKAKGLGESESGDDLAQDRRVDVFVSVKANPTPIPVPKPKAAPTSRPIEYIAIRWTSHWDSLGSVSDIIHTAHGNFATNAKRPCNGTQVYHKMPGNFGGLFGLHVRVEKFRLSWKPDSTAQQFGDAMKKGGDILGRGFGGTAPFEGSMQSTIESDMDAKRPFKSLADYKARANRKEYEFVKDFLE